MMSRAAQTHLAGHMRPTGRVFETPALGFHILSEWPKTNNFLTLFRERTKLGKTRTKYDAGDLDN